MTAVQVLLECCGPQLLPDVLTRRRQVVEEVLRQGPVLGPALVRAVLDSGDEALRLALAGNRGFPAAHPEAAAELAATATPPVAVALLRHADEALRAELLAGADPADPWWRRPGGFVPTLVDRARYEWELVTDLAGRTPFEEIDHVFLSQDRPRTVWRELEVLAQVWRRAGRDAVVGHTGLDPLVAETLTEALDAEDGLPALERATAELRTAAGTVRLLRAVGRSTADLDPDQPVDWPAVLAAHAEQPYRTLAAKALAGRADCPEELRVDFVHRFGVHVLDWFPGPVGLPVMRACAQELANGSAVVTGTRLLGEKVAAALEQGTVTAAQVVEELAPVGCLPGVAVVAAPVRTAVGDLVGATVGTDQGAWRALWKHLSGWPGNLPELLAAAVAAAGTVTRWAHARPAPAPGGKPPSWTPVRRAMRDLLLCCPPEVVLAVLPVLDGRAAYDLLHRGAVGPDLVAALVEADNLTCLRLLAGNRELPAESIHPLFAFDDTEINAGLYQSPHATPALRRRILAGLRHDEDWPGGPDRERLPIGDQLRAHLREPVERRFMLPWIESGLTELAVELMLRTRVPTALLQLRLLLAVARREGVPAARALLEVDLTRRAYQGHPWLVAVRKAAVRALADPDEATAVRAVQALVDRESTPDKWLDRLRRADPRQGDLYILDAEQHVTDWTLLLAEHRREPFPYEVLGHLGRLPGCPAELLAELAAGPPSADDPGGPVAVPRTPDGTVDWTGWPEWATRAVTAGTVPLAELAANATPVGALLRAGGDARWWPATDDPVTMMCREVLGENLDAWLLALDLVDNFPGTLPELVTTSRAATAALSPR
ncbi:hypothetical protein [Plantactinospora sp. B24E8]|uniref:hypothetical protein n=1 Tax=Plantactinospora sp. B24E8 TaxID=3153567 RepID=UPI00325D6F51